MSQTMTLTEILIDVNRVKPVSFRQLQRYIKQIGIPPVGARQRPQRYPADTALRIKTFLGCSEGKADV